MCGIAGVWDPEGGTASVERVRLMMSELGHRGPDAQGLWAPDGPGPVLGHTRLAIQDLTAAGSQPMKSRCGRYCIVLNGEIYNHWELRRQMGSSRSWRGRSDTETLVEFLSTSRSGASCSPPFPGLRPHLQARAFLLTSSATIAEGGAAGENAAGKG